MLAASLLFSILASRQLIQTRVDPRIELVTTVFRLAGADEFHMSGTESAYTRDVDQTFASFKNHSAVLLARKLREKDGIGFDAVLTLAVNLTDIESLKERIPFDRPPARWDKRWPATDARAFVIELRKFVKDTKYEAFLEKEKAYIAKATGGLEALLAQFDVSAWLTDLYGTPPGRNSFVIIGLLCGGGNYGMSVEFPGGDLEISPVFGAHLYDTEGFPAFGENDLSLIMHEFSHSYVNPLVHKDFSKLRPAAKRIMRTFRENLAAGAYGDADAVVYESFVRAAETHLVSRHLSPELARTSLIEQRSAGFLWTSDLMDKLDEFERDRGSYKTFAQFLPILEDEFIRLSYSAKDILARCPKVESLKIRWGAEESDGKLVTITARFSEPMDRNSRGLSFEGEGYSVIRKTEFDTDGRSFHITLRLKKGSRVKANLNRFGRGLVGTSGYPLQRYPFMLSEPG